MSATTPHQLVKYFGLAALAGVSAGWLAGCASSKLNLDLAIYSGDPAFGLDASENEVTNAITRATAALEQAKRLHDEAITRTNNAEQLYQAYAGVFAALSKGRNPPATDAEIIAQLGVLRDRKARYVESLSPLVTKLPTLLDRLQAAIANLNSAVQQVATDPANAGKADNLSARKLELKLSFASVQALLILLDFKSGQEFTGMMNELMKAFKPWLDAAAKKGMEPAVRAEVEKAAVAVNALAQSGSVLLPPVPPDLTAVGEAVSTAIAVFGKNDAKAAESAHAIIATSPFRSMQEFEALQDAADPRWRVVKDPRNESKWVEQKSQTYFYSEGKNSVVVVRDRPDDFRVQNGSNNPTALVRSQLEISRAVGSAALAISGAALGTPKLAAIAHGTPTETGVSDTGVADGEKQAADAARVAEEARLRKVILDDLRAKLRRLEEELDEAQVDGAKIAAVNDKLYALLESAKTLLPAPPPTP